MVQRDVASFSFRYFIRFGEVASLIQRGEHGAKERLRTRVRS